MSGQIPLIVAHRGASAHAPENTLAAFRIAIESGAEGVEFDVQLTKNGVPVVFHDFDMRRMASRRERIVDLDADDLADLDIGSWFNATHGGSARTEFVGERIPTLDDVLRFLEGYGGRIYVELKANGADIAGLTRSVCDAARRSSRLGQMIFKSFRMEAVPEIKRLLPGARTAALFSPGIARYLSGRKNILGVAKELGADEISVHRSLASRRLCESAREANIPVTIWTVDSENWIERCTERSIAALITNDPANMLAARDRRPKNS